MPHIFYALDFTVSVFVVHGLTVLLCWHRALDKWLPVGGHIELGENPEEAVRREVREETGLSAIEFLGDRPNLQVEGTDFLYCPAYLDVHSIRGDHRHVGMIYFVRSASSEVTVSRREHHALRWWPAAELRREAGLAESIRFYALEALRRGV